MEQHERELLDLLLDAEDGADGVEAQEASSADVQAAGRSLLSRPVEATERSTRRTAGELMRLRGFYAADVDHRGHVRAWRKY